MQQAAPMANARNDLRWDTPPSTAPMFGASHPAAMQQSKVAGHADTSWGSHWEAYDGIHSGGPHGHADGYGSKQAEYAKCLNMRGAQVGAPHETEDLSGGCTIA
jgi:hypothetical protein